MAFHKGVTHIEADRVFSKAVGNKDDKNTDNSHERGNGILEQRKKKKLSKQKERSEKIASIMRAFGGGPSYK